ncbi:MAG: flagellar hook capping FlgD N-terminal domain-containing protein [Planctomycetota bacterium]
MAGGAAALPAGKVLVMETYAIASNASTAGVGTERGLGEMSSQDFFKLLVTELQQQDPLEPTATADMISQVSQIRSIELSQQLTSTLDELASQQRTNGLGELLGKYVEGLTSGPDGSPITITGVVTGVRFGPDGTALLELDTGQSIRAVDVSRITTPEQLSVSGGDADKSEATAQAEAPAEKSPAKWLQLKGLLEL